VDVDDKDFRNPAECIFHQQPEARRHTQYVSKFEQHPRDDCFAT
jgi:hypothetical protein